MYSDHQIDGVNAMANKQYALAIEHFGADLRQAGNNLFSLRNTAICLAEQGIMEEAYSTIRFCNQLFPIDPDTLCVMASIVSQLFNDNAKALQLTEQALNLMPHAPNAMWNMAHYLLKAGQWSVGWQFYKAGYVNGFRKMRCLKPALTDITFTDPTDTILVWCEQGVGDFLMMLRYVRILRERRPLATIILEGRWDILPLITDLGYVDRVYSQPDNKGLPYEFDHHCSIMDLPTVLGMPTPYASDAYMTADPNIIAAIKHHVPLATDKPNIGLFWAGNPVHSNDKNRSMSWDTMKNIITDDFQFLTLQPGMEIEDVDGVLNLNGDITSWAITAGILANLDLLVTVDSGIGHLAGAMGIPTLMLHAYSQEWRWSGDWYKDMHHLRQTKRGDWHSVIEEAKLWLKTTPLGPSKQTLTKG